MNKSVTFQDEIVGSNSKTANRSRENSIGRISGNELNIKELAQADPYSIHHEKRKSYTPRNDYSTKFQNYVDSNN